MENKIEDLGSLIKDNVIDVNTLMNYLLERFKIIALNSRDNNSINSLKRLFNIILKVKEAQLIKIHQKDIESNP